LLGKGGSLKKGEERLRGGGNSKKGGIRGAQTGNFTGGTQKGGLAMNGTAAVKNPESLNDVVVNGGQPVGHKEDKRCVPGAELGT